MENTNGLFTKILPSSKFLFDVCQVSTFLKVLTFIKLGAKHNIITSLARMLLEFYNYRCFLAVVD